MTTYRRPLHGFRFVEIRHGDTLQAIAARELGDASRWTDLIAYNDLVPPFITDHPALVREGVLLSGGMIRVPAAVQIVSASSDPDRVFERDIRLDRGEIMTLDGDFDIASGRDNLRQAIKHRIETERGELLFHPEYGSRIRVLLGTVNGPTASLLAAEYARSAVLADPRIRQVTQSVAEVEGDVVRVSVEAQPIAGRVIEVTATP